MDIVCSVGKDGMKRYFRDGKRVKAPSGTEKPQTCKKSASKKTTRSEKKKTPKKTRSKKTDKKKPRARLPDFHIWEVKTGYTTLDSDGKISSYYSDYPVLGEKGKTFRLPFRHVEHLSKYDLETQPPEYLEKNPEKYAVYNLKDHLKITSYPYSLDQFELKNFSSVLPLKDQMKHIWTFRNLKRPGGESFTFIKPVMAFYKLRKSTKEAAERKFPGQELFWVDSESSDAMEEIVSMRENWTSEQWDVFENNIYIKIAILSKLKKL